MKMATLYFLQKQKKLLAVIEDDIFRKFYFKNYLITLF